MADASPDHAESTRCYAHKASEEGPGFFQDGDVVFQAHHVGWIVCGIFTIAACISSFWLVDKHLTNYTNKRHQRFIVRLLFMVPLYAIVSFASFLFWNHAIPLILVRDTYESIVLTAFFYLLLYYIGNPEEQRITFLKKGLSRETHTEALRKGLKPATWMWPLGFIKARPADGLYYLQMMKWGVLQYCVIKPITTLAALVLNYMGLYCEQSWGLGWGHIWIVVIVSISVTIAMYCLLQVYMSIKVELAPQSPLLKLFAVKAVVFLTFWQATALSGLSMLGIVKDTKFMTAADINIGFGALLQCFEMMLFGFLHIKAFSYKPYCVQDEGKPVRTGRWKSLGDAMNFKETFREIWAGCIYMWDRMHNREPRQDYSARRIAHMENAFERARPSHLDRPNAEKGVTTEISVEETVEVDVAGERQWLGHGNDYGYGLQYQSRREKSESLEAQIRTELLRRGYEHDLPGRDRIAPDIERSPSKHHGKERSWWRNIYNRVSQSGADGSDDPFSPGPRRVSRSSPIGRGPKDNADVDRRALLREYDYDAEDPPPSSAIRAYSNGRPGQQQYPAYAYQPQPYSSNGAAQLESPPPPSMYSDSMLGRVFPYLNSPSATDIASSASASSQSHPVVVCRVRTMQPVVEGLGEAMVNHTGNFTRQVNSRQSMPYQNVHMSLPPSPPGQGPPVPTPCVDDFSVPPTRSMSPMQYFPAMSPVLQTRSPPSNVGQPPRMTSPPLNLPLQSPSSPTSPGGLRRAPAHRYSNDPRPTVQPIMPALLGPSMPQPAYPGQSNASRRMSTPSNSPPAPSHRTRYSMDNTPSMIVEPSRSRTNGAARYPTRGPDGQATPRGVSGSSYPVQPPTPTDRVQNVRRRPW